MGWKRLLKAYGYALALMIALLIVDALLDALTGTDNGSPFLAMAMGVLAFAYGKASWDQLQDERCKDAGDRKGNHIGEEFFDSQKESLG